MMKDEFCGQGSSFILHNLYLSLFSCSFLYFGHDGCKDRDQFIRLLDERFQLLREAPANSLFHPIPATRF